MNLTDKVESDRFYDKWMEKLETNHHRKSAITNSIKPIALIYAYDILHSYENSTKIQTAF